MDIRSNNKATLRAELQAMLLAECDPDIQQAFQSHFFSSDLLLVQLVREMKKLHSLFFATAAAPAPNEEED